MSAPAPTTQLDELGQHLTQAAHWLVEGRFHDLAERYGYALCFSRPRAGALQTDLATCLVELGASSLKAQAPTDFRLERYPAGSALVAAGSCQLNAEPTGAVLLELVASLRDGKIHFTLEQLSALR